MGKASFNKIVWPLGVAETIVWAGLYYTFPAMLLRWEAEFGWSKVHLTGAFTLCVLISALLAPVAGRAIDRGHGPALFAGSAAAGAVLLSALTVVSQLWQFYCVWALIGVSLTGCLYEPCFAIITRSLGGNARRAITAVSLMAGLAGTVSFPAAWYLSEWYGWRTAILVFAATIVLLAVPLIWRAATLAETSARANRADSAEPANASSAARQPAFWALALAVGILALNHAMLLTHTLPLLDERGTDPALGVLAMTFIGPMQVLGRIIMLSVERTVSSLTIAIACQVSMCLAALSLAGAAALPLLLIPFVILQGAGNGVTSIIRPVLTAELFGRQNFGVISGLIASVYISGFALGPSAGSLLWQAGGYALVLGWAAAMPVFGLLLFVFASRTAAQEKVQIQ